MAQPFGGNRFPADATSFVLLNPLCLRDFVVKNLPYSSHDRRAERASHICGDALKRGERLRTGLRHAIVPALSIPSQRKNRNTQEPTS